MKLSFIFQVILAVVGIFLINSASYTLLEHEQALVLQFGRVVGEPVKDAGLHWKLPFFQSVKTFEKRVLQLDGEPSEVPTLDRKFILVDTTARWRIENPHLFYQTLRANELALSRMSTLLAGITKDTVSAFNLTELVRNSNNIFKDLADNKASLLGGNQKRTADADIEELAQEIEEIRHGREEISRIITERTRKEFKNFGIYLVDVQIRSIAYKEVVEEKVYSRMVSERMKMATQIRSVGSGEAAKIQGQLNLSLKKIESEAYRKSQEIRGEAEAKAIRIYAQSMKGGASFYEFTKTLETYKKTLGDKTRFILSTDSGFLRLLDGYKKQKTGHSHR